MSNYCVYKHTCPNGKVYVGITGQNPIKRWANGKGYSHNEHFWNAIILYGWQNIRHEILYMGLSKEEAEVKEIELISLYKSNDREFGYNIDNGGNSIGKLSEETKKKIREAHLKIPKEKHPWYGKHLSEEHKRQIGKCHKGKTISMEQRLTISNANKNKVVSMETRKKMSERLRKPIRCITTDEVFSSILEASEKYKLCHGSIGRCCKGEQRSVKGYVFEYI